MQSKDVFLANTLKTSNALPHALGLYTQPSLATPPPAADSKSTGKRFLINSATFLFDLRDGLIGHNGILHGGFPATLIDEAMGGLMYINNEIASSLPTLPEGVYDFTTGSLFTAGMNIKLLRPVPLPIVMAAVTRLDRIEGRKVYFQTEIRGEKETYVSCEGLWIAVPHAKGVGKL